MQSLRHPGGGESGGAERGWQAQQRTQSLSPGRGGVSRPRLGLAESTAKWWAQECFRVSGKRLLSHWAAFPWLLSQAWASPFCICFSLWAFSLITSLSAVNSSLRKPWYFRNGVLVVSGTCDWNPVPWTPRGERLEVLGGGWWGGQGGGTMPIGQLFRNGAGFLASQAGLPSTAQLHRALLARVQCEGALRGGAAQQRVPPSLHPLSLSAFLFLSGWTKYQFP